MSKNAEIIELLKKINANLELLIVNQNENSTDIRMELESIRTDMIVDSISEKE
ncbi:hypothetical protein A5819_003675 [Enterococcus sp. 7E2_DIV0204]|uniref:hypothetical protein n=1 Tax=unclassified Enterococcus TaxID=2608891 RepID=UPI000B6512AC|nr:MULTISPECIES: hypothetical protein [unclassified Enterococcus]OTN83856.1 hypothetical protein A5819_003675 [Enterococcus sp. 7E2_DIV0204]OTP47502.1 hypothetical protein A5884_003473 [Enterococcus sp. 7D2_DIV0200]